MPDVAEIAKITRTLGAAQKRGILNLPGNGDWGVSGQHQALKRLWLRSDIPHLIDHRHLTDDCWSLRPTGLAVRAYLENRHATD